MDGTSRDETPISGAPGRSMDIAIEDAHEGRPTAEGDGPHQALPMEVEVQPRVVSEEETIDPYMLQCATEMFAVGPGWPVLPPGSRMPRLPTNLELQSASVVVDHLFTHEKARFEIEPGRYLQQSEARGYLLAVLFGRGLLRDAQTAHDIGNKAGKQIAAATQEATTKGKAARKRQPEEVRDAKAATARERVWGQFFDVFAGHRAVPKQVAMPNAREAAEEWAKSYRPASASHVAAASRAPRALLNRQSAPAPAQAPAPSPTTDETPRHLRLRPPEADAETSAAETTAAAEIPESRTDRYISSLEALNAHLVQKLADCRKALESGERLREGEREGEREVREAVEETNRALTEKLRVQDELVEFLEAQCDAFRARAESDAQHIRSIHDEVAFNVEFYRMHLPASDDEGECSVPCEDGTLV